MSAILTEQLVAVAQAARVAGHGRKGAIYARACAELGLTPATLQRKLAALASRPPRKRRADAGRTALSREEAMLISALLMESARKNGKRLYAIGEAVQVLRSNGAIRAEFVDKDSGEMRCLSDSTIARALRGYGLHPEQLLAPAPVTALASSHPNHVWQVDASLCVLYYLTPNERQSNGLQVMDQAAFYKNKPRNVARVAADRVWRYVVTDHTSGWLYVEYVMGAESGENLCNILINAMQARGNGDVMHGVPRRIMTDPGAAMTGAMFRNLCRALGVGLIINQVGNARAKGQVEQANNLVETKFEPGLKLQPVADLAALNDKARAWRVYFNHSAKHGRHGLSRTAMWMRIRADQLVKAPSVAVCRELAIAQPESRKVSPKLWVSFQGRQYDVSSVPGVMVGAKLMITRNPWRDEAAQVVLTGEDGYETFHVVDEVLMDEFGFAVGAALIGENYKRHADTPAQEALKEVEQLVTGAQGVVAVQAARKAKVLPFGGRIDPYKHVDEVALPSFLPRRGADHTLRVPQVVFAPLALVEAAKRLKPLLEAVGGVWDGGCFQWLQQHYAEGVALEQLDEVAAALLARSSPPVLTMVKTA